MERIVNVMFRGDNNGPLFSVDERWGSFEGWYSTFAEEKDRLAQGYRNIPAHKWIIANSMVPYVLQQQDPTTRALFIQLFWGRYQGCLSAASLDRLKEARSPPSTTPSISTEEAMTSPSSSSQAQTKSTRRQREALKPNSMPGPSNLNSTLLIAVDVVQGRLKRHRTNPTLKQ